MLKQTLMGLVGSVTLMMNSLVYADALGETDDSYIGFQITIPFDSGRKELFSKKNEYSLMLINQIDGIKKGIAFTQDIKGNRAMGYVLPSQTFKIGQSRFCPYQSSHLPNFFLAVMNSSLVIAPSVFFIL